MAIGDNTKSFRWPSRGALLIIGLLIGVFVSGAVGVFASTSNKTITVCADKKTNVLRYAKNSKCSKNETRLRLNQNGSTGPAGPAGATGATGQPGEDGGLLIKELWICDGRDANSVADERCKIGMNGPAGGVIFFVDYMDQYDGFNYLEASETNVVQSGIGLTPAWCSDVLQALGISGWKYRAVGQGAQNTARMLDTSQPVHCTSGAAKVAADYSVTRNGVVFGDWFLPSIGELELMHENLHQIGIGAPYSGYVWSSTESDAKFAYDKYADVTFGYGTSAKDRGNFVRPVRAF